MTEALGSCSNTQLLLLTLTFFQSVERLETNQSSGHISAAGDQIIWFVVMNITHQAAGRLSCTQLLSEGLRIIKKTPHLLHTVLVLTSVYLWIFPGSCSLCRSRRPHTQRSWALSRGETVWGCSSLRKLSDSSSWASAALKMQCWILKGWI